MEEFKDILQLWQAKDNYRVTLRSDETCFIATIRAGCVGETVMSVGYSSPNGSLTRLEMEVHRDKISRIREALDVAWEREKKSNFNEMAVPLLKLCMVANSEYYKLLDKEWFEKLEERIQYGN